MLQSNSTFFVGTRLVVKGEVVDSADPIVKGREALFAPVVPAHPVEQATAAPGEKRTATRPAKKAAAKAED